jgi:hypothetical protein
MQYWSTVIDPWRSLFACMVARINYHAVQNIIFSLTITPLLQHSITPGIRVISSVRPIS